MLYFLDHGWKYVILKMEIILVVKQYDLDMFIWPYHY